MKSTKSDWFIPAALIALSLVPTVAGAVRLSQLAQGAPITSENARFFAAPVPVVIHIIAVTLYSMLGAFQFSPGLRQRHRRVHRVMGWMLVPTGLAVALSGLWMTVNYPWPDGDGLALYVERLVFGLGMLLCIVFSQVAIARRTYAVHGQWMTRAYAIALGAGTQVFTHLPWLVLVDRTPGELPRAVMMGAGWVINVVVAEWVIRGSARERARLPRLPATNRVLRSE